MVRERERGGEREQGEGKEEDEANGAARGRKRLGSLRRKAGGSEPRKHEKSAHLATGSQARPRPDQTRPGLVLGQKWAAWHHGNPAPAGSTLQRMRVVCLILQKLESNINKKHDTCAVTAIIWVCVCCLSDSASNQVISHLAGQQSQQATGNRQQLPRNPPKSPKIRAIVIMGNGWKAMAKEGPSKRQSHPSQR